MLPILPIKAGLHTVHIECHIDRSYQDINHEKGSLTEFDVQAQTDDKPLRDNNTKNGTTVTRSTTWTP
jgi:hypothetical protein